MATVRSSNGRGKSNSKLKSKVVAPRNPKLVKNEPDFDKQTPSAFMAEMALTTDERLKQTHEMRIPQIIELLDMSETTHQKFTMVDIEMPLFQPFPSEIVFQNYEPFETYTVPLRLRNNDKVARLMKVSQTDSPYFKIISPADVGHKVAPGMDTVFQIRFTPDEKKDYNHELICITEREKFLVPVKAVGARAMLDFPDDINFQSCPVKYATTKTLLVRNVGNRTAKFQLLTESPFTASPDSCVLGVAESIQVDIMFHPMKTGDFESNMVICYDTGENIYVTLYGVSMDMNVRLDKNTVKLENTYVTSASQRTVSIMNRSDVIVHFEWKPLATLGEELQQKQRFYQELSYKEEEQRDNFLEECISDPSLRDKLSLVTRSFKNRIKVAEGEKMLYSDDVIAIDPVEGDIWPNSHADINVIFKPDEAKSYARTVYCDVTGRETRLPLRIRGDGIGSKIQFSFDALDIENVFVNSDHSYEVILKNVGDIDAVFCYEQSESLFGQQFDFTPTEGIIIPGGYQAIQIHFTSPYLGDFSEDFFWTVEGSPERFKFTVRGCVIGPTFHFDVPKLQFNTVSYGFTHIAACKLINTSLIPMTFYLRVPSDGIGPSAASIAGSFLDDRYIVEIHGHESPREFDIYPNTGALGPQAEIEIQVNLTSLSEQKYETYLVVDVEGVGQEILSLPISARCIVPGIAVETPIIDYGRCFIRYPYEKMVVLKNETDLPAKYELLPQIQEDRPTIRYSTHYFKGIIQPQSIIEIPLQITAHGMEKLVTSAFFMIYGCNDIPLQVQLTCIGEGPVVHVNTLELDYGAIPVLEDITRHIKLSNESLIPAEFHCEMVRPNSLFSVGPARGIIPAERATTLIVTANVDDCLRFQDKLKIGITDGQLHTILLTAHGNGTTIVSEPPMQPMISIGATFSLLPCTRKYRLINKGRRSQQIFWSTEGFPLVRSKKKQEYNKDDIKYQRMPPPPAPPRPVFKLKPDRMSLSPGQSQEVVLEGYSEKCQQVRERMICHAIVGSNTGKEKIMKVDIVADFIEPLLQFSERKLSFFVLKHPHTDLSKEVKELLLGNVSKLPLRVSLDTEYPFYILADGCENETCHMDLNLEVNQSIPLVIEFDPDYIKDKYCRTAQTNLQITYHDHPNTDNIELTGDVYYPNLHFEADVVDFGCVLNDTEHLKNVTVTNNSPLKVIFKWSFQENAINFESKEDDEGLGRDISDGEEDLESKTNVFYSPQSTQFLDATDRPRTSPAISHLPIQMRPQTAPESSELQSRQASVLPWAPLASVPENISIQEVFDVLPLYGELEPGETQQFQFTFYGHSHALAEAVAVCSVHGGPDYRILLKGQASLLQYGFDTTKIDLGRQIYDHVITTEIVLFNRGKVNFDFTVIDTDRGTNPLPGGITVLPVQGIVGAQQSQTLTIRYMPGFPEFFQKQFRVRVGHFEPEIITLVGEGIFPRITFDLPRDSEDPRYLKYLQQAKDLKGSIFKMKSSDVIEAEPRVPTFEKDFFEEVDRLQVKDFAVEMMNREQDFTGSMVHTTSTKGTKKLKHRAQLSDYVMDFGFVNLGSVKTNSCIITNASCLPVSFAAEKQKLASTGFTIEYDKVKDIPEGECIEFTVAFDPKAGNLSLGPVETVLPIKMTNGPSVGLRLKGVVTMPDIQLSAESIDFESVVCGQCKVVTVQMYNYTSVRCQWTTSIYREEKKKSRRERIHQRKKNERALKDARTFEMMPPSGSLYPGQRVNVQVKFMPTEEESYSQKLVVSMYQSTSKLYLTCRGRGVEPKIELEKLMVNFGPVLPHAHGDEEEIIVKNPGNVPIEFYCLEFDKKYLEEEKILRAMKGYDEYNTILLPPRSAGDDLPKELLEAYKEMSKKKEEGEGQSNSKQTGENETNEKNENEEEAEAEGNDAEKKEDSVSEDEVGTEHEAESDYGVGELEITPISAAIARHLGIDLSAEGKAARNRRGIALIVHGAPLAGKSATAAALAEKYKISLLRVDDIVKEAISNGTSSSAIRARELSTIAARNAAAATELEGIGQQGASNEVVATASTVHPTNALGVAPSTTGALHAGFRESRKATTQPVMKQHKAPHVSPPSTPPLGPPPPRKLSMGQSTGDAEYYSCILPDDLLVEIIAEKLQSSDCQMGVVFDGLDSMFAANMTSCANALLRAINNRKYIFAITLKFSKERLKMIDERKKAEKAKKEKEEQEAEKIRLEEMSEDEYEALPEEEKAEIDRKRLEAKKLRMKKKETEEQREREIREEKLAEERRLEEEKAKPKAKRAPPSQGGNRKGHEKEAKDKKHEKSNDRLTVTREATAKEKLPEQLGARVGTSGNLSERSESIDDTDKRKMVASRAGKRDRPLSGTVPVQIEEVAKPSEEELKEKELNQRFQAFELCLRDICTLFEAWDRTTGSVFLSESEKSELEQETAPVPVTKKGQASHKKMEKEKEKEKEREKEREREKEKTKEGPGSPISAMSEHPEQSTDEDEAAKAKSQIGVPNVIVQTFNPQQSMLDTILNEQILPAYNEVQDGLGLGPSGPPIPPSATFSVVPYPRRRKPAAVNEFGAYYVFVANSVDDPNAIKEEKILKAQETEVEKTPDRKDHRSRRGRDKEDNIGVKASRMDRLPSGTRKGRQSALASVGQIAASPPLISPSGGDDEKGTNENGVLGSSLELVKHRWVIQAEGEVKLRIKFSSPEVGRYDQTLNFEIVGTRRRYQLFCRGVCCFPTISREPRIVFPHRKKYRKADEIVHKKYILSNKTYEFGPLLAGKNRDRYREGRYPENMEQLCISNTSSMEADISFCFQNDTNGSTFLLEPATIALKPNENQTLNIWAYPKTPGFYEDLIVGCIKENPEPVIFKVSCHGVRPELELDKRIIQFDRVLLYRTETRTVFLRNSTLLPIAWKVSGMDNLGDDFSVPVESGVIEPKTEFALQMDFKAIRATNVKKIIRLEVSDAANIMGLTHAENIQVQAEAYDVALDMSFPKGADGGIDFTTLRVFDESKQSLSVKNKGRYEIGFSFVFEASENCPNPADLFTVVPNKGTLIPSDRPTQVQVMFRSKDEVTIKDEPILKCQIIEPSLGDTGEVIAGIPVKISVRSVYSRYSIFPVQDINFGAILVNTRKTRTITIENKGEFDFRYSFVKMQHNALHGKLKQGIVSKRSRDGSASGRSQLVGLQAGLSKQKRTDSVRGPDTSTIATNNVNTGIPGGAASIRLQLGMFTISPASGAVLPGNSVQVNVDMFSEASSISEEEIAIDISDRSPLDCPGGIEYRLMGETCLPSICTLQQNVSSIFEEHRIVSNLNVFRYQSQDLEPGSCVYGEEENKFVFYNVIVGHRAKARIKISNPNKVICDVVFSIKPISNKPAARWTDVYDVEPQRAAIQPHSYSYVTITFHPPSMQSYFAVFEAAVDGLPSAIAKGRNLIFDIQGDGNLPRVSVIKPTSVTAKGNPLLLFNRLLTNRTQMLPLVLKNEGTLPCKVNMTLIDPECCFTVIKDDDKGEKMSDEMEGVEDLPKTIIECTSVKPVMVSFEFHVGEISNFMVEFTPSETKKIAAEIRLSVVDNPFEDTSIQLLGEGFEEEVTVDNIHGAANDVALADIDDENYAVPRNNSIDFGDCAIHTPCHQSFTLTNHSENDVIRFMWDPPPQVTFIPRIGHLLPSCAKDIKVTFQTEEPIKMELTSIPCKIAKIKVAKNAAKAGGWDDRMRTVKWVDVKPEPTQPKSEDDERQTKSIDAVVAPRPAKRKVVETEPEPSYTPISGTSSEIELLFNAVADYARYELNTSKVFFKDTLMFQTRMYSFKLKNTRDVQFDYHWSIEPGWTREPTEVLQMQPDEKPNVVPPPNQTASVKSAKSGRDSSKSPKQPIQGSSAKTSGEIRPTSRVAASNLEQSTSAFGTTEGRATSRMASASDGRPATAMALAYEAGSVFDEPSGSDVLPFTIEPAAGCIKPLEEATFTIRFSPMDTKLYGGTLIANIPNLEPGLTEPVLLLYGRSMLPWCHFELEESNYISSRRNPELKGPGGSPPGFTLDPNTKVIEFISCGIKTKSTRRFFIMNPTRTTYSFSWTNEDSSDPSKQLSSSLFTCLTPKGSIEAGKKVEIVFEYLPDSVELQESFWRFYIQEQNVSVSFLLVGMATDPAVSLDKSHLNFKELLVGHKGVQTFNIVNDEEKPFQFSFDKESLYAPGRIACLKVAPMVGTVQPRSKLPVTVEFIPSNPQEVNFNLICRVKKKTALLAVNIKAEGFSVDSKLICEDSQGNKINLFPSGVNLINLGEVEVNEKVVRQLFVENSGKFNIDFNWELIQPQKPRRMKDAWTKDYLPVSIVPDSGTVQSNARRRCQLSFCPPCPMSLSGCHIVLGIVNGPQYRLDVAGSGTTPLLKFSFESHDFGPCFIHRPGLPVPKQMLVIENKDSKEIGIECQYKDSAFLEIMSEPKILGPGEMFEAEIYFYPRELKRYHVRIPFEINGLSTMYVDVTGQGTDMKVEVVNPMDKKINLGAMRIGQTSNHSVKIVNNSLAAIEFSVTITPSSPALQQGKILSVSPLTNINLKPKEVTEIGVQFHPKGRIPQFTEEVILECAGISHPLFVVTGSCHGLEVKLDSDAIPFGSVTIGSSSSRKLIMYNTGDIGAAFCWNVEKFKPDFTISPVKGYIAAGMEVTFDITFTPNTVSQDIRYDNLRCAIEGARPLKLVLTGSCISQLPMKEVIHFQSHVRNRDVKNLMIHNKTNQPWLLKPVIDGEYWSGPDTISIDPQQGKNYEIIYRPLTMTLENKKHAGTIFFALPDGSGLLYNLTGSADPPKPISNIQRDVPCKMPYTEVLQVSNWLRKPQRFRVTIEMLKPEKPDPATTLKGLEYADVPGLSKKEYKLSFYAHKEGTFSAKVTFKNEQTLEYQFYYVQFKATSPGVISVINLSTPVRQSASEKIIVNNPLQTPVTFQLNCNVQDISFPPQRTVPPQSEQQIVFEYLPMKSGETTARLSLQSSELGLYLYDLNLTATPANPERPIHFITNLGMNQTQTCRFINYARSKVEYACRIDNSEYLVDRSVTAASASSGGSEVGVDVTFEPTKIGDSKGFLTITSNSGGEYVFPLFGHCLAPKPQGPYTIKAGGTTSIPFKNVFPQTTSFVFLVDNPCFTVKSGETIRGKKTHNISVGFEGNQGESKAVRMGRLVVSCVRSAGASSNLTWTFYLKGITP